MRLAKYLAHCGVASRRAAEDIVVAGRVAVNGEFVRDPARDVQAGRERVTVDGRPLAGPESAVVYAVHKPLGTLSTARDPQKRPTVVELVPERRRLYPVGRLDADSSGLMLLTNDGELANRLTHPRYQVPKTYRVRVSRGPVSASALRALRAGVQLEDGPTAPASVRRVARAGNGAQAGGEELEVTLREGRNRQLRRMCEAVGYPVVALQRVAFGSLRLDGLAPGAYRRLHEHELSSLRET